jgi:hypothetical protein
MRSAIAPMISAGVMIAKVNWKITQMPSEMNVLPAPVLFTSMPFSIAALMSPM